MDFEEFPRAECHQEEMQQLIQEWEAKHSTPAGPEELREFAAAVHFDHEECECDCCMVA